MGGELGLSSGFDSRIILACRRFLSRPLALHTHATSWIGHQREVVIVKEMASACGLAVTCVPASRSEEMTAESNEHVLYATLEYFDGRTSRHRGAFHATYTPEYRKSILGANRLSLNGIAGEIYRNDTDTGAGPALLRPWLELHDSWDCTGGTVLPRDLVEAMYERKLRTLHERLEAPAAAAADIGLLRRFLSELRYPDADGHICNAHNQIAFFHAPFLDARLIANALAATAWVRNGYAYVVELIRALDPGLSRFMTHRGYALERLPLRERARFQFKSRMPERFLLVRRSRSFDAARARNAQCYESMAAANPFLRRVEESLRTALPFEDYGACVASDSQRRAVLFFGAFLNAYRSKIRLEPMQSR